MVERLKTIIETEEKASEIIKTAKVQVAATISKAEQEGKELIDRAKADAQKRGAEIREKLRQEAEKQAEDLREEAAVGRGHLAKAVELNMEDAVNVVVERLIS